MDENETVIWTLLNLSITFPIYGVITLLHFKQELWLSTRFSSKYWSFLYSSSVYSCYLLNFSTSVRSIPSVLYWAHLCMKCSLDISDFLEEISSLSHSIVFLYFFALISEEGFLISSCYSLELCIQMLISFLFSFAFCFFSFTAICKASPDSHFTFLHFFVLGMVLITAPCTIWTSIHASSDTLSDLTPWIYFWLPLYNRKGFDLGHTLMV